MYQYCSLPACVCGYQSGDGNERHTEEPLECDGRTETASWCADHTLVGSD